MARPVHHWALERMISDALTKKQLSAAVIVICDQYVDAHLSAFLFNSLLQKAAAKSISL